MHDGMPYGLNQGQGHVALKLEIFAFSKYLVRRFDWELANDC